MRKIIIVLGKNSIDGPQVLEYLQSLLIGMDVIPIEITRPYNCVMSNLIKFCLETKPDVVIGFSEGAMFVQQLHGYRKILVNPMLHVSWDCATTEGVQFGGITNFDKEHSYIFFADDNNQANVYEEYMQAYKNVVMYQKNLGIQELIDMHVCPIVNKMLDEGPDQKNIDAIRTYELLTEISGGGRDGRAALFQLEEALEDVLTEVTTCFYKTFYDGRQTAWKGFRKITREFVFDIEDMPYGNYTKYLYERLHSFIKGDILEQEFLVAANAGNKMASIDALTELAYLFTHSVEGTYENTLAYQAGTEWLKKYKKENRNQDELSMQPNFFDAIPFLIDSERPELVLQYMEWDEKIETAVESYKLTTPETMKALCWGIYQIYCRDVSNSFFEIMKVLVNDDNTIDVSERAIFFDQDEAEKALLDWSTNNREHLLCYVMRTIPMCEHYSDDFIQAAHYAEGEQLKDDMLCKEFVYMSTGFRRKQNFNIGDNVKYICFDGRSVLLRHSRIFQILTNADESIQMNDGFVVPARYVFSVNKWYRKI